MNKKVLMAVIAGVLALAIAGGAAWCFLAPQRNQSVGVIPFEMVGMLEYWGDNQESYGPVTTDRIQTVFLSATQTVTEVFVQDGDTVKKGDLLLTFDTTLSDIALERERLKVEKLKLELQDAYAQLADIKNMKPYTPPAQEPEEEENQGVALTDPYLISQQTAFDGSTQELALVCWLKGSTDMSSQIFTVLHTVSLDYRAQNALPAPTEPTPTEPAPAAEETQPTAPAEETQPTEPEPTQPPADPNRFYVVLKTTQNDMSLGATLLWQGLEVTLDPVSGGYRFRFYDASGFQDHTQAQPAEPAPAPDYGSGYTADELAQMRAQQEKAIRDLQFQIKVAEADYKIKQTEVSDGNIYASIDGTVIASLTQEEAKLNGQPFLKVSGGGGFYVEGSISELERDSLQIGQEVTVNDWDTGMTYTGTVEAVQDYPSAENYFNGAGNPNSSYYPFTVFIDGSADLQEGRYVSVTYSLAAGQQGVYLENAFLRTEGSRSYVYVRGEDGRLEKRYITTGKALWGSYIQILEGLELEDYLAFPYGKAVKPGAPTYETDLSELYGG